jgi:hypothetical protein
MASLQDKYEGVVQYSDQVYDTRITAQVFGVTSGYTLTSVELWMDRDGSPGTAYVEIYATDPDDDAKPTGAALASQSFDADTLVGTGQGWVEVALSSPIALTRGTTYALVLRAPNGADTSNDLTWRGSADQHYFNGVWQNSTDNGASWSVVSGRVLRFRTYGVVTNPTYSNLIFSDYFMTTGKNVDSEDWMAQVFTAVSSSQVVALDIGLYTTSASAATLTISIFPTDANDEPDISGAALGSTTLDASTIAAQISGTRPTSWSALDFSPSVPIVGGEKYAIVVSSDTSEARVKVIVSQISVDSYTGVGNKWFASADSGATWANPNSDDFAFKLYVLDIAGVTPTDVEYNKKLVAAGGNQLWYEATPGTMSELAAATGDIDCGDLLNIFEGYGKVFVTNKTNLKVADFQNSKITTADVAAVEDYPQFGALIAGGTSGAAMTVDYITSLSGACTIYGTNITDATFTSGETVTGTNPDGTSISFTTNSVEDTGPHWYDWATYGNDTTFGALPPSATLGCLFRGRAVISGNALAPHQWYMSRQANPFNWLYGINDAQSAVAGNNTDAGEVGDVITALIPYKDDFLIFGCVDSIWYMTGDPTSGGSLDELDLTTGIFGANSWCWGAGGELYFWGLNGIYKVTLPGGVPQCISEIRLPGLIADEAANPGTHRITMCYDKRRAGIMTTITKLADGSNSCYWFDFRTNGFFPESYSDVCGVYSSIQYNAVDSDYKQVMYGCNDGYIRFHDDATKDDDATEGSEAIESYVTFGPFLMSSSAINEGKITGFDLILGGGGSSPESDGAQYELYTGTSAQEVVKKMAAGTPIAAAGSMSGSGRKRKTFRRKVRGVYCGIKVKNITLAQTWAMEQALISIGKAGRLR